MKMKIYLVCKNEECSWIEEVDDNLPAYIWLHHGETTACNECKEVNTVALISNIGGWSEATRKEQKDNTVSFDFNKKVPEAVADRYDMLVSQYEEMLAKCR